MVFAAAWPNFLRVAAKGTNQITAGGSAQVRAIVGTNPLDIRTFNFSAPQTDASFDVSFGNISATLPFNTIMGLVASASINNFSGQNSTSSASADFLQTLTLQEIRLTSDAAGNNLVPLLGFSSNSGLVITVENGVGVPLVGTRVGIDLKPEDTRNSVNPRSAGRLPVAILATPVFNPVQAIDRTSLAFGVTGREQSFSHCGGPEDVNGDARLDLVCHFRTESTGIERSTIQLILRGRTNTGEAIHAADVVTTVGR